MVSVSGGRRNARRKNQAIRWRASFTVAASSCGASKKRPQIPTFAGVKSGLSVMEWPKFKNDSINNGDNDK